MLDHATAHHRNAVGYRHGFLLVMGNIYGGDTHIVLDLFNDCAHFHPQLGIQVGQGLVHEQYVRLDAQRPGKRHTLLLAAGEAVRHAVGQLVNLHQL